MRDLATILALLRELREARSFVGRALGDSHSAIGGRRCVEETGYARNQAAPSNFHIRRGDGERRGGAADRVELLRADNLIHLPLAEVLVSLVVGDKAHRSTAARAGVGRTYLVSGRAVVGLGVEVLVVVRDVWQQRGAGDGAIERSVAAGGNGSGECGLVRAGTGDGLVQGNCSEGGLRGGRCLLLGERRECQSRETGEVQDAPAQAPKT